MASRRYGLQTVKGLGSEGGFCSEEYLRKGAERLRGVRQVLDENWQSDLRRGIYGRGTAIVGV